MKVHLFNFFLLLTVGGCLFITLSQATPESTPIAKLEQAFIPVSPSPHPIDAYRTQREYQRKQEADSLSLLSQSADAALGQTAEEALLSLQMQSEKELMVEGVLAGMGYGKSVCVLQNNTLSIFTSPAVSKEDAAIILQKAAEICLLPLENMQLMVP